jgi:cell division protein FtsI/penicillin-binding protein 2
VALWTAEIATGGKIITPHLISKIIDPTTKKDSAPTFPTSQQEGVSSANYAIVRQGMSDCVSYGSCKLLQNLGFSAGGKTGTAQVPKKDGRGYEENNNIGSFIGFGPVESPKFLMLVRIDHPRTVDFAESTAAPAFGELAKFILNYYQVPPSR